MISNNYRLLIFYMLQLSDTRKRSLSLLGSRWKGIYDFIINMEKYCMGCEKRVKHDDAK